VRAHRQASTFAAHTVLPLLLQNQETYAERRGERPYVSAVPRRRLGEVPIPDGEPASTNRTF